MQNIFIRGPFWLVKWLVIDLVIAAAVLITIVLAIVLFVEVDDPDDLANCRPPTGTCEYWGH